LYERKATITTKVVKTKKMTKPKKLISILIGQSLTKAPLHRLTAILRRNEGFIKFKVEVDIDDAYIIIDEVVLKVKEYSTCSKLSLKIVINVY
jgi:uncharacterized protein